MTCMRRENFQWLVPIVLAFGVVAALWFYWSQSGGPETPIEREPPPAEPPAAEERTEPVHPLPEPRVAPGRKPELRPLPPLDQSDEYFEMAVTDLFGEALEEQLADARLIERIVATVDNLPRDQVAERIKPLDAVPGSFAVDGEAGNGAGGRYTIDPANYERYAPLVAMAANTSAADMAELYRRFYPLFQKAYADLGYPDAYFNDRVVEVIDHLLSTPEVTEPVELVRPHVLYQYKDPELEKLSSGQKALLRIGSENAAAIKARLREFRELIAADQ
jgi:hypothetical protein